MILDSISPYIYGTTRLGDDSIDEKDRLRVARAAMDAGVWFHTSNQYGSALNLLGKAFSQDRARVPNLIIKMGGETIEELKAAVQENIAPLGVDSLPIGQLCLGGRFAESLAEGGYAVEQLKELRETGLVQNYVMEVFPWTSEIPLRALRGGHLNGLVDAFIFYFNPLQRFVSNELWDDIQEKRFPIIAMRTVSGGPVHLLRDVPGFAWQPYLQQRAEEVAPIFEKSGIESWTEFCVRFPHSIPNVKATVGSSVKVERLQEFIDSSRNLHPLPASIINQLFALQVKWAQQVDSKAEPWTM